MARKTVSLEKRMKKKISAQAKTQNNSIRSGSAGKKNVMDREREGKEPSETSDNNVEIHSSVNRDGDLERNEPEHLEAQHDNHQDDQACNCFLRRGQMFLPPSMVKTNNNYAKLL